MYLLLLVTCAVVFVASTVTRSGSFASPTAVLSFSLLCAVVLAMIGFGVWNPVTYLSGKTYTVIATGLIVFLLMGEFVSEIIGGFSVRQRKPVDMCLNIVMSRPTRIIILSVMSFGVSLLWYVSVSRAAGSLDPFTISFVIKNNIVECETNLVALMRCFCSAVAALACVYVAEAIFGADGQYRHKLPFGLFLFTSACIPPAVHALRTDLFHIVVGFVVVALFLAARKPKSVGKTLLKIMLVILLVPAVVNVFFGLVDLMQRTETGIKDPWNYFSFYLGSGIPRLDILLRTDTGIPTMDFEQLANSFQVLLHNLHLPIEPGKSASEKWTYLGIPGRTGDFCNLSTLFGPAYSDFGFIGVVIVSSILGVVFHLLYQRAVFHGSELALTIYSSISYILVEAVRDDFFSYWLGTIGLSTLIFTVFGFLWLTSSSQTTSIEAGNISHG